MIQEKVNKGKRIFVAVVVKILVWVSRKSSTEKVTFDLRSDDREFI